MRRLPRICAAAAVFAVAVALVPPFSAAPAVAAGTSLAGVTTITAEGASSVLVSLPRAVTVSSELHDNPDFTIEGSGRFNGVALVQEAEDRYGAFFMAGRLDPHAICDETGCPYGAATPTMGAGISSAEGRWTIPPGEYRLHVIAEPDAGPLEITLRLKELTGETQLFPGDATELHTVPLAPSLPLPQSQSVYWNGARHDMGTQQRGLMWSMVWLRHPLDQVGEYHYCPYRDADPGDHPGCPGTVQELAVNSTLVGGLKAWVLLEGFTYLAQGDFAQKVWFAGNRIDGVDGLALWLPFGEVSDQLPGAQFLMRATVYPVALLPSAEPKVFTKTSTSCFVAACDPSTNVFADAARLR